MRGCRTRSGCQRGCMRGSAQPSEARECVPRGQDAPKVHDDSTGLVLVTQITLKRLRPYPDPERLARRGCHQVLSGWPALPIGAPWRPAEGTLRHSLCSHPPASPHRSAMGNQKPPSPAPRAHPHRVAPRPAAQPDAPARVGSVPAPVRRVSRGAQAAPAPEHLLFCLGSLPQTSGLGVGADEVARRPLCQTFPSRWRHNPIVRPRLRLR